MTTFGSLTYAPGQWTLDAAPHVHMLAKRIFPRLKAQHRGTLTFAETPELCRDLAWFLERYPMTVASADLARLKRAAKVHRDRLVRLEAILNPNYVPPEFALTRPPRTYQAREAAVLLETGRLLVGDDVGLGKTVSAIAVMTNPRALPAIVVCAPHLQRQWAAEIEAFAPDLFVHVVKKGTPYALPQFFGRTPDVLIITYHKLAGWEKVLAAFGKLVVFDEVQELRHTGTARYGAATTVAGSMGLRLGLSATPIHNYGGEIYNILEVLEPGCLGTREEFHTAWCSGVDARGRARLADPKAFGAWCREQCLIVRHTRKEVGRELPDVIRVTHLVDSDAGALEAIKDNAAALARIILAAEKQAQGAQFQAAEQFSALLRQATGIAKAPYVADFVRLLIESGERVVLCGWHRAVYDVWLHKLRDFGPRLYTGSETPSQKDAAKADFISGKTPLLILSLRSGAGMNGLQDVSSCIVFGELDYAPAVHEQCIGRLARDGQLNPVVAYFLLAESGADPVIAQILGLKREQLEGIRNPTQDFLERVDHAGNHVRKLAQTYLEQIGRPLAEPVEAAS